MSDQKLIEQSAGLSTEDEKLYTVAELAAKYGLTTDGMRKRIKKLGLAPVVPSVQGGPGVRSEELYSEAQLSKIQQQQQRILEEKKANAAKRLAEGMDLIGKQAFVSAAYDSLELDDKIKFMLGAMQATLQALNEAQQKVEREKEELEVANAELNDQVQVLSVQCDVSANYFPALRTEAGQLTVKEHRQLSKAAFDLGFTDGELEWGWTQETFDKTKRYARIQVKSANDKYPAWAYPYEAWHQFGFIYNETHTMLIRQE